jgi:hypothetical protein
MTARRAILTAADLRRMAQVVRSEGVTFRGRVDETGGLSFTIAPTAEQPDDGRGDLDDRLANFASQ